MGVIIYEKKGHVALFTINRPEVMNALGQPDFQFLFSLMSGDMVEIEDNDGRRGLFVVRGISERDFTFARHTCAMLKEDMKKTRHWLRIRSIEKLRQRGCRKVSVDPLGRVREAND